MVTKMKDIEVYLNAIFVEREEVIQAMLTALIARQHLLLISPPGTAKSALSSELAKIITDADHFSWLLTKFSTPDELFGPVSLKGLEQDVFRRKTEGKLPHGHLAFLDEVFKANSAILNALLTIMNERIYYNDNQAIKSPLMSLIAASNEYPQEESLEALFDRFLLRFEVGYIQSDNNFVKMLKSSTSIQAPTITLDELYQLQDMADMIDIPAPVINTIVSIRSDLMAAGIQPSDRRYRQSLSLLQARALLEGRPEVILRDLLILKDTLWVDTTQRAKVKEVVELYAMDRFLKAIAEIQLAIKEINNQGTPNTDVAMEQLDKLRRLENEAGALQTDPARPAEYEQPIKWLLDSISSQKEVVGQRIMG